MTKLDFHSHWIRLIMNCISSVSFSILINGKAKGFLSPFRGLRQGDPLSPHLFLLCSDGFSSLLLNVEDGNLIKGISIACSAPISH